MITPFELLVGAAGDVRELEYISALMQTDVNVRLDCSLRAQDIRLLLVSRYGIMATDNQIRESIMQGFGDGCDDEVLDMMQIVALLMIPTLLKAAEAEERRMRRGDRRQAMKGVGKKFKNSLRLMRNSSAASSAMRRRIGAKLVQPPNNLLESVLEMILHDGTGSTEPVPLDLETLRDIFTAYGEVGIASNDALLEDMVEAATTNPNGVTPSGKLDLHAFFVALTSDVKLYDTLNEVRSTTNYQDVFEPDDERGRKGDDDDSEAVEDSWNPEEKITTHEVKQRFTAPSIDITAGTYRSKGLMVFLWATMLISYYVYAYQFSLRRLNARAACKSEGIVYVYSLTNPWSANKEAVSCEMLTSIKMWNIFFLIMTAQGLVLVSLGSMGNYLGSPFWKPILASMVIAAYLTVAYIYFGNIRADNGQGYLVFTSLALGGATIAFHFSHVLSIFMRANNWWVKWTRMRPRVQRALTTSQVVAEMHLKRACSRKITGMAQNALNIVRINEKDHVALNTRLAQSLDQYAKSGKQYRTVGGITWTIKRLMTQIAAEHDGIWISTRLIASNMSQYIVSLYVLIAGISFVRYASAQYDTGAAKQAFEAYISQSIIMAVEKGLVEKFTTSVYGIVFSYLGNTTSAIAEACNSTSIRPTGNLHDLCVWFHNNGTMTWKQPINYLNSTGLDTQALQALTQKAIEMAMQSSIDSLYPSHKYMVMVPIVTGAVIAFLTSIYLAVSYMPSVITTILQLRSGGIAFLRDKDINRYRRAPDEVTILTGSLFWGCLIASVVVGSIIALILFFFLWQATALLAQRLLAISVGVGTIALSRLIIVYMCKCSFYTAFYRSRPAAANMTLLGLEWASFAISGGFVFLRMCKLLIAAAAWIGRIDRPFLSKDVRRLFAMEIDFYPMVHTQDLLSHEAHRHPYVELLGVMYMMKLRYDDSFGTTPGSCWRLLFVYALFPWLHPYRTNARPEFFLKRPPQSAMRPRQSVVDPHGWSFGTMHRTMNNVDDDFSVFSKDVSLGASRKLVSDNSFSESEQDLDNSYSHSRPESSPFVANGISGPLAQYLSRKGDGNNNPTHNRLQSLAETAQSQWIQSQSNGRANTTESDQKMRFSDSRQSLDSLHEIAKEARENWSRSQRLTQEPNPAPNLASRTSKSSYRSASFGSNGKRKLDSVPEDRSEYFL